MVVGMLVGAAIMMVGTFLGAIIVMGSQNAVKSEDMDIEIP